MKRALLLIAVMVMAAQMFTGCASSSQVSCPGFNSKSNTQLAAKTKKAKKTKKTKKADTPNYAAKQNEKVTPATAVQPLGAFIENGVDQQIAPQTATAAMDNAAEVAPTNEVLASRAVVPTVTEETTKAPVAVAAPAMTEKQAERLDKRMDKLSTKLEKRQKKAKRSAAMNDKTRSTLALVGGILGICSIVIPVAGLFMAIAALVLGILGLKSDRRGWALTGIILGGIGVLFFFLVWGALLGGLFALS